MLVIKTVQYDERNSQYEEVSTYSNRHVAIFVDTLFLFLLSLLDRSLSIIFNRFTLFISDACLLKTYIFNPEHKKTTEKCGILKLGDWICEERWVVHMDDIEWIIESKKGKQETIDAVHLTWNTTTESFVCLAEFARVEHKSQEWDNTHDYTENKLCASVFGIYECHFKVHLLSKCNEFRILWS